jgi:hypothetical protein
MSAHTNRMVPYEPPPGAYPTSLAAELCRALGPTCKRVNPNVVAIENADGGLHLAITEDGGTLAAVVTHREERCFSLDRPDCLAQLQHFLSAHGYPLRAPIASSR